MPNTDQRLEEALTATTRLTVLALALTPLLLLIPTSDEPRWTFTIHLSLLVAFSIALTMRLGGYSDDGLFTSMSPRRSWLAGVAATVALVVGATALVTLASSAALRLDPSLQFLQLLSALDIAWAAAALYLGIRRRSTRSALPAALALGVFCVWSILNYFEHVGFTPSGGWLVDGTALMTYVIPNDMAAGIAAIGALFWASRHPTAQRRPQS